MQLLSNATVEQRSILRFLVIHTSSYQNLNLLHTYLSTTDLLNNIMNLNLSIQFINNAPEVNSSKKEKLQMYFCSNWWTENWRRAWLDHTRLPLAKEYGTTMTTNNAEESLNRKLADAVGGRAKKMSFVVSEIIGEIIQAHPILLLTTFWQ